MAITPMTGSQIVTKFRNYVNDSLEGDFEYQLLNDAKNEIEQLVTWEVLKYMDSTQTVNSGDTISTTHALPSNFNAPIALFVGSDYQPYNLISFEDQRLYRDFTRGWIINAASSTYALTGTAGVTNTIYLVHTKYSDDIAAGTSWSAFPARFHDILPIYMAKIYYTANAGEKGRAWDDRLEKMYTDMLKQMQMWDFNLKNRAKQWSQPIGYNSNPRVAFY
jgi:hypothetical protein